MKLEVSESSGKCVDKKRKKTKKLASCKGEDEITCAQSVMINEDPNGKKIHKTKSGKYKKIPKGTAVEAEIGINSIPDSRKKKKKSAVSNVINGHEIMSKKCSRVDDAVEQKTDIDNSSTSCTDKKRKWNKGEKTRHLDSEDSTKDADKHCNKKLKTGNESDSDKTVISSSNVQPGAFENYRISPSLANKLLSKGIESLFPVQSVSFDAIYDGHDVILQARTGSGKTLSFAIPLLEKLPLKTGKHSHGRSPQVLVMAPTRELAKQVSDTFEMFAASELSVLSVYGGTPIWPQERSLRSGVDVLVGTPGRIKDLLERGSLDLSKLNHVVLDEVDRMLDMGFADDVDAILTYRYSDENADSNPQTLLFSATLPHWVHATAKKYLRASRRHFDLVCDDVVKTSTTVTHFAIRCGYHDRAATIGAVLQVYGGSEGRAMVFCEMKREADELALSQDIRQETHVIHGDISQDKREMVLKGFRDGRYKCLIATDVAARGLDIPEVDLVIQCCPPKDVESYIHRSGRTGRAGRDGTCVLFFKPNEESGLAYVEQRAGIKFKVIGPPSSQDVIEACAKDAVRTLEAVTPAAVGHFRHLAEQLIVEKDAVELLSAALAVVSGNTDIRQRSLLSSREGLTTFLYRTGIVMNGLGYAWKSLERCFSANVTEKFSWMTFCADRMGCVFDVPSDLTDTLLTQWNPRGSAESLDTPSQLPQLMQKERTVERRHSHGAGPGAGGGRGWRTPFRGGSRGGQSRDFNRNGWPKRRGSWNAGGMSTNSRKTFD